MATGKSRDELLQHLDEIGGGVDDPDRVCAGWEHSCAIDANGNAKCWGSNHFGQAKPPDGLPPLMQIGCGLNFTCALSEDGTPSCWGAGTDPVNFDSNNQAQSLPPDVKLQRIAVSGSGEHVCGIDMNGGLVCWGAGTRDKPDNAWGRFGQSIPPTGSYVAVSVGQAHSCALGVDGKVACWGGDGDGRCWPSDSYNCGATSAPSGEFVAIAAGGFHTCALRADGSIACWGQGTTDDNCAPDSGGAAFACGQSITPAVDQAAPFVRLTAGTLHTCALKDDLHPLCWGWNEWKQGNPPPNVEFSQIAAGDMHGCGLALDGSVKCWGYNSGGRATPPTSFAR
jgi:alpha-tubulin suppressor-like RCC1 family protein